MVTSIMDIEGAGVDETRRPRVVLECVPPMAADECSVWTSHLFAHLSVDILRE